MTTRADRTGALALRRSMAVAVLLCVCASERLTARQCPDGSPPPCRISARPAAAAAPDSHVIAVLPFRVAGADSALAEGLAELLAVEFTGEGTLRAADMGTVLRAWRSAGGGARQPLDLATARRLATRIGAGRMLTASVVGTGQRLSLSAQVLSTTDGAVKVRAGPVQGTMDSLPDLMRAIASQLMTTSTGVRGAFADVPTEALRSFMAARAAYRLADWPVAARLFERALQIDSTFAYAALGRRMTEGWVALPGADMPRMLRLLWTFKDRLDPVHRALAIGYLGPRYPEASTAAEVLEARAATTRLAPDNPDAWLALGDELAHRGDLVFPDGFARGIVALERALALDSGFSEAALHMSTAGLIMGDMALTRRGATNALRISPTQIWAPMMRLDLAITEGRGRQVADSLIRNFATIHPSSIALLYLYHTAPEYADTTLINAALSWSAGRATTTNARNVAGRNLHYWLYNRGRPGAADSAIDASNPVGPLLRLASALFAGGDGAMAARNAAALGSAPELAASPEGRCLMGVWASTGHDSATARSEAAALRTLRRVDTDVSSWCAPMIDAAIAVSGRHAEARRAVALADSIIAQGMPTTAGWEGLMLGRLWAALEQPVNALRAVRRREWFGSGRTGSGAYLSERLRAEGRWAALSGDTAAARVAYRQYLRLRVWPEAPLRAQRDSVVTELQSLGR